MDPLNSPIEEIEAIAGATNIEIRNMATTQNLLVRKVMADFIS